MNEVLNDLSNLRWNRNYRIWEPFMRKYDCQHICEIGVRTGQNFWKMCKHNPKVAIAIDIWKDDEAIARNDKGYSQKELDEQYEVFMERFGFRPCMTVLREYSFDAVKRFPDGYFDLIYIDADHTYEGVYKDIVDWYPKVKKGGFLLGDDFSNHKTRTGVRFGVMDAVNNFSRDNNLSYFVFPKYKWGLIK